MSMIFLVPRAVIAHKMFRDLQLKRRDPEKPLVLAPLVRLANKYLVDSLRTFLVRSVVEDWPLTLEEWDIHAAEQQTMEKCR